MIADRKRQRRSRWNQETRQGLWWKDREYVEMEGCNLDGDGRSLQWSADNRDRSRGGRI